MSGRMSRNKGAAYERKIAKILSAWWGEKFFRTPLSGGHQDMASQMAVVGDIITKDKNFPFHLELKKQEGWALENVLTSDKKGKIGDWIAQAKSDCKEDKIPFLIFSKNYHPDFFLLEKTEKSSFIFSLIEEKLSSIFILTKENLAIGLLDDFLKSVKKDDLICKGEDPCPSMDSFALLVERQKRSFLKSRTVLKKSKNSVVKKIRSAS